MNEAKIFLDKKQEEHFNKFGVYADVNSKIAEWMQEYTDEVVKKLTLTDVSNTEGKLQAVEDLKEFARNNCREWNVEEMEDIIDRL